MVEYGIANQNVPRKLISTDDSVISSVVSSFNMANGHTCDCSSKTGFPSSQNHSQINNSANTTRYNTEQDNLVVKSSLKLTWTGDFQSDLSRLYAII